MNPNISARILALVAIFTLAPDAYASYTARAALSMSSSSAHGTALQGQNRVATPLSDLLQKILMHFPIELIQLIEVYVWKGTCIETYDTRQLSALAYAFADNQLLLPIDTTIDIFTHTKRSTLQSINVKTPVKSVIPVSQHHIAVATTDDLIQTCLVENPKSLLKILNHRDITALIPSVAGQFYIKKEDNSLHHINADTGSHASNPIYYNDATKYLFALPDNGVLLCLQSANKKEIATIIKQLPDIRCLVELPPKRLATGHTDGTIQIWNLSSNTKHTIKAHTSEVTALQLLHNGLLASGSESDGPIKLWDIRSRHCISTLSGLWICGIQIIDARKQKKTVRLGRFAGIRQLVALPNGVLAVIFTESNVGEGFQTIQLFS